jgi:hypothetical protein
MTIFSAVGRSEGRQGRLVMATRLCGEDGSSGRTCAVEASVSSSTARWRCALVRQRAPRSGEVGIHLPIGEPLNQRDSAVSARAVDVDVAMYGAGLHAGAIHRARCVADAGPMLWVTSIRDADRVDFAHLADSLLRNLAAPGARLIPVRRGHTCLHRSARLAAAPPCGPSYQP